MIELLFAFALNTTDYKISCISPTTCPIPVVEIRQMDQVGQEGEFRYDHPTKIGVVSTLEPGSLEWQVAVVHEFTHYLQWRAGKLGPRTTCQERVELEREAYKVGSKLFATKGIKKEYYEQIMVLSMDCLGG